MREKIRIRGSGAACIFMAPLVAAISRKNRKGSVLSLDTAGGLLFWALIFAALVAVFVSFVVGTPRGISGTEDNIWDAIMGLFS